MVGLPWQAAQHRAELHELGARQKRDDVRQRRFAGAGRAPQDQRRHAIFLDHVAQQLALAQELLLAHDFFQRLRTHAVGQRWRRLVAQVSAPSGCFQQRGRALGQRLLRHRSMV
jgi:hypothetical protein